MMSSHESRLGKIGRRSQSSSRKTWNKSHWKMAKERNQGPVPMIPEPMLKTKCLLVKWEVRKPERKSANRDFSQRTRRRKWARAAWSGSKAFFNNQEKTFGLRQSPTCPPSIVQIAGKKHQQIAGFSPGIVDKKPQTGCRNCPCFLRRVCNCFDCFVPKNG